MTTLISAIFVSHSFPPGGGSGVQRVYKFVKYLPDWGIAASVLTARKVVKSTEDKSLLRDLHPKTKVIRTMSIDPMIVADMLNRGMTNKPGGPSRPSLRSRIAKKLFPLLLKIRDFVRLPDQYICWFPFGVWAGLRHVRSVSNPVIIASLPVYTTALIAYCLSRWTGAPLILDFRDAWVDDPYLLLPTRFHRWLHQSLERKIVNHAKHLIVYGEWLENVYRKKYPNVPVTTILNGFDSDDFRFDTLPERNPDKIRIVYSGSIFQYHREFIELTFEAATRLDPVLRDRVEFVFAGEIQLTVFDELVHDYGMDGHVTKLGYIAHRSAIEMLLTADALLFTIPRDDISSYTSKIFEYLAAQRPIISFVCERGIGAKLLREFGHASWIIDYDAQRAFDVFTQLVALKTTTIENGPELVGRIERKQQAHALAAIIRSTMSRQPGSVIHTTKDM